MAKKSFTKKLDTEINRGGIDSLLGTSSANAPLNSSEDKPTVGRPRKPDTDNFQRATFIVKKENLKALKAIAYYDRMNEKDAINKAIETYVKSFGENKFKEAVELYNNK